MQPTNETRLLELIGDVQGLLDLAELREGLLSALQRAVPSDWASLNEIGSDPALTVAISRPPLAPRWHEKFALLAHENPLLALWRATRDGRAYRFSDVATEAELRDLALFREVYAPLGVRHQIAFTLPSTTDRVLAIALSRRDHDYTDSERDLLNHARPFLIQAYRNALAVATPAEDRSDGSAGIRKLLVGEGLTNRQAEVLVHAAHGASNRDIAARLAVSDRTVQKHLELAFRKLGVRTRSQAADRVWALAQGQR